MNTKEAIRTIESTIENFGRYFPLSYIEKLDEAVTALRAQAKEEKNDPLTLDELREMDGEPVWIVEHPDWGHWELSEDAEDYLSDRDEDFYGMRHDDPNGKYGLHMLGWLAYRRKPGEGAK